MTYPQRVADNILPISIATHLPEAFTEWSFTEEVYDHERSAAVCQLCDQEQLRYHFRIRNEKTMHALWVGSKCILKFGISIFADGSRLGPEGSKRKLNALTKKMQESICIRVLERLAQTEQNEILIGALDRYKRNKDLTPKQASVVFWRLRIHRIEHHPSFFKISLQRADHRRDLKTMEPSRVHEFWAALSASQKRLALSLGHQPPPL